MNKTMDLKFKTDNNYKMLSVDYLILYPAFLCVFLCLSLNYFAPNYLTTLETSYSFLTWFIIVVLIDVSHVYATFIKLYKEHQEHVIKPTFLTFNKIILLIIILWLLGILLFIWGGTILFWSCLAYIAVFHFIRQQYGIMRFYAQHDTLKHQNYHKIWDSILIYTATIYPMIFWFLSKDRNFHWFMEYDFYHYDSPVLLNLLTWFYRGIIASYAIYLLITISKTNLKKHVLIVGTFLSWYVGIVFLNHDLTFMILNIISHGIPYMAFVYNDVKNMKNIKNRYQQSQNVPKYGKKQIKSTFFSPFSFIFTLLIFGISEEFLWENLIWKEHLQLNFDLHIESLYWLLIPLLSLPQLTHYVLDGIIWKRERQKKEY
jgi:hypothetical protein